MSFIRLHFSTYILFSNKQEWRNDSHNYLGEVPGNYAEQKEPNPKGYKLMILFM